MNVEVIGNYLRNMSSPYRDNHATNRALAEQRSVLLMDYYLIQVKGKTIEMIMAMYHLASSSDGRVALSDLCIPRLQADEC
jgi:hypothetical protein